MLYRLWRQKLARTLLLLLLAASITIVIYTVFPQTRGVTGPLNAWLSTLLIVLSITLILRTLTHRRARASRPHKEHPL